MVGTTVTITRGSSISEITRLSRSRHHTDDSSLGSFKFEDHESTEHDGDVEDYSEGENGTTGSEKSNHRLMYYPPPEDTVSNQFTVNAMDVEELRKSQRRSKKPRSIESGRTSEMTASGSQEDSDSEGGASTPSAERNPLSIFSENSLEGYDQLTNQREKFLKNAFESLSGAEDHMSRKKNTSISSQFHGRTSGIDDLGNKTRNATVVQAAKQTRGDTEAAKKKEELQRRIEETRRTLQSVGYRSSLKSSQSIADLSSHVPDKHHRQTRLNTGKKPFDLSAKPINACKPILNPKTKLKRPQLTNKLYPGVGNPLSKLEVPKEKQIIIPKSQTTACIVSKTKPRVDRPITLTLKKTEKYKLSLNKTNQSLPESPVCEEFKVLKEHCKRNMSRFAKFAQKRRSCSYFIGLNDNEKAVENIAKSFESLPAMECNISENDDDEENGNFSDDSLEEDFKNPPRRCISDYQINVRVENKNQVNVESLQQKTLTRSQESILSDVSIESYSKDSAEILDPAANADFGRHSSASFFLSRRKMQTGRSQESILTDESDYQMFPLRENADHRSTESVLTDDSDSMVKSAPLEILFDSHYKRRRQRSENFDSVVEEETSVPSQVFRSKSLQDTSLNMIQSAEVIKNSRISYELNDMNNEQGKNMLFNSSMSRGPQSLMIVNDFVAHKPPKPKRNSVRTQSMRNRVRPTWNNKFSSEGETNPAFENDDYQKYQTLPTNQIDNSRLVWSTQKQYEEDNKFFSLQVQQPPIKQKEIFDSYDSLEANTSETKQQLSVDDRMTKAIEGTVKLLSQEFENLVRKEQYFASCKSRQEHFAKLEAERDTKYGAMRRDGKGHSGGEDSDCADISAMDKSIFESSSSTPLSSGTNSPKRMWPPASRCHSQMKWTRTLPTISQSILPSKQYITVANSKGRTAPKVVDSEEEGAGMRRACSLSDLSIKPSNRLLHGPVQVSGKVTTKNPNANSRGTNANNPNVQSRHLSSKNHSSHITRSSSVGVLNQQSDSESDAGMTNNRNWNNQQGNSRISALMRPTISSQNKINHQNKTNSSNSNLPSVLRRRGMQGAYSSINLSQVGNQEDSSSEDTSSNGNSSGKPSLIQRPRSISIDHSAANLNVPVNSMRRTGSTTVMTNGRPINIGSSSRNRNQLEPSPQELPVKDTDHTIDVGSAELSTQLCSSIADELTRTADNVVQLYKRLTMDNSSDGMNAAIDRDTMLRGLESSVNEAMRTLRLVVSGNTEENNSNATCTNEATAKFQELLAGQDQGKVVNMMQQYSELLLSLMKQNMGAPQVSHT